MKKSVKLLVVFLFGLLFLTGCFNAQPQVPPPGCEHSLIVQKIPNYRNVDILLQIANLEALKQRVYTKEQALDALDDIEKVLKDENATYSQLLSVVVSKVNWVNEHAGAELFILSQYFEIFKSNQKIDPCDRDLLLAHLAKQRAVILMDK